MDFMGTVKGSMLEGFYPADESGKRDLHTTYIAEIVDCYMIEE